MDINVRLEGGAGDCLLGHRFCCSIKDKYPNAQITAYIDSEGKQFQKNLLTILYPTFYKEIKVIPNKKFKKIVINSQFTEETYIGAIENVPDDIREEMETKCDKFYDLHIDSLKWVSYDFDWIRYLQYFPKPELPKLETNDKYVAFHLVSNTKNDHGLEKWYIATLVNHTSKYVKCKLICTADVRHFYSDLESNPNVEILDVGLQKACSIISAAKCMFSIDSGLKYIAYSYDVPTLCMSKQVSAPTAPFFTHQVRWMPYPQTCFPIQYDAVHLSQIIKRIYDNKGYILQPLMTDFDSQIIKRNYTVNQEKSIL